MKIRADKKNYKAAFEKHFHAYSNWGDAGSYNTRRLALIYCVECGLKFLIMQKKRINSVSEAQKDIADKLGSHDFYMLLNEVNQAGQYSFPRIKTEYGEYVSAGQYHQLCRYCIRTEKGDMNSISVYDSNLHKIACWLKEQVM